MINSTPGKWAVSFCNKKLHNKLINDKKAFQFHTEHPDVSHVQYLNSQSVKMFS